MLTLEHTFDQELQDAYEHEVPLMVTDFPFTLQPVRGENLP